MNNEGTDRVCLQVRVSILVSVSSQQKNPHDIERRDKITMSRYVTFSRRHAESVNNWIRKKKRRSRYLQSVSYSVPVYGVTCTLFDPLLHGHCLLRIFLSTNVYTRPWKMHAQDVYIRPRRTIKCKKYIYIYIRLRI